MAPTIGMARHVPQDGAIDNFEGASRDDYAQSPLFSEVTHRATSPAAGAPARRNDDFDWGAGDDEVIHIPLEEILRSPTQKEVDKGTWHEPTAEEITPRPPPPPAPTRRPRRLRPDDPSPLTPAALAAMVERKPGTIRVASWNLLNLSEPRELERRARVLAHFDLVALQEIKKPSTLNKLRRVAQRLTGATWHRQVSPKVGRGQKAEHLAFLYRTDRIQAVRGQGTQGVWKNTRKVRFDRPPFFATFRAGDFDFTVVNYHARWGSSREITREVEKLPAVVEWVQERNGDEQDVIVVGDFNRHKPTHPAFVPLRRMDYTGVVDPPEGFSTYSSTPDGVGANLYDNIFVSDTFTEDEYTGTSGVLYLHRLFFTDRDSPHMVARIRVSDHCPVWADFATAVDDD
jgi:endonuclease/exonuclease/phosphatase family metal-dependent hydrolase